MGLADRYWITYNNEKEFQLGNILGAVAHNEGFKYIGKEIKIKDFVTEFYSDPREKMAEDYFEMFEEEMPKRKYNKIPEEGDFFEPKKGVDSLNKLVTYFKKFEKEMTAFYKSNKSEIDNGLLDYREEEWFDPEFIVDDNGDWWFDNDDDSKPKYVDIEFVRKVIEKLQEFKIELQKADKKGWKWRLNSLVEY